jgi:hypothetical protein
MLRSAALLTAFLAVGFMRRGPKLYYEPLKLGTGFGINAAPDEMPGGKAIKGKVKPGDSEVLLRAPAETLDVESRDNVLDYQGCSMLSFVFLAYVGIFANRRHARGAHGRWPDLRTGRRWFRSCSPQICPIWRHGSVPLALSRTWPPRSQKTVTKAQSGCMIPIRR